MYSLEDLKKNWPLESKDIPEHIPLLLQQAENLTHRIREGKFQGQMILSVLVCEYSEAVKRITEQYPVFFTQPTFSQLNSSLKKSGLQLLADEALMQNKQPLSAVLKQTPTMLKPLLDTCPQINFLLWDLIQENPTLTAPSVVEPATASQIKELQGQAYMPALNLKRKRLEEKDSDPRKVSSFPCPVVLREQNQTERALAQIANLAIKKKKRST